MRFELAPFGPLVRVVVVVDIAQHQAVTGLMDDHPNIAADAHRPEVFVFGLVELVETQAGIGRIHLQIEGRGLGQLLLFARQAGKAIGESVGNDELHRGVSALDSAQERRAGGPRQFEREFYQLRFVLLRIVGHYRPAANYRMARRRFVCTGVEADLSHRLGLN